MAGWLANLHQASRTSHAGHRDGFQMAGADKSKKWFLKERLLQSQKLAALGELSAGIAHEINNPLAIIRQEAEWMSIS